jgi:peptidoglycan/LPS O-acetylase OafA/YrhL
VNETAAAGNGESRLGFLDVLRGIAALMVALYHLGNSRPGGAAFYWVSHSLLNFGAFGVLLFFVVSGFIIPASLERRGSLSQFWIGRVFRLVPLFWLVVTAVVALWWLGLYDQPGYVFSNKLLLLVGNATLLTNHIGASSLVGPAWTLPFEISFYLLTSVLFITTLRYRSLWVAIGGALVALVAADWVLVGSPLTPGASGNPSYHGDPIRAGVVVLVIGGALALMARGRAAKIYAGVVGVVGAAVLLNRPLPLHEAIIFITVMFAGTMIYRISAGQLDPRLGWTAVGAVSTACAVSYVLYADSVYATTGPAAGQVAWTGWTSAVALLSAVASFVIFFLLRDKVTWPAPLRWLGRISYSVYLIHFVVFRSVPALPASVPGHRYLTLVMWLAITLAVSDLTYRFVEQPAINLGRRVARRVSAVRGNRPPAFGTHVPVPAQRTPNEPVEATA